MTEPLTFEMIQQLLLHSPFWQETELRDLLERNPALMFRYVQMPVSAKRLQEWQDALHGAKGRRGEIVLAIENNKGEILLHTKSFYPDGVFRMMTGGIHYDESVLHGLQREAMEETGAVLPSITPVAVLFYTFMHENQRVPFISYLFHTRISELEPKPQDTEENISAFRWVDMNGLQSTIDQLLNLAQEWEDWGRMRSLCHLLLLEWKSNSGSRCCCG
jgi:8-oxo-dGTP pyrophosphatase MutT (NUDIX family)